jgi:hypothetical protein
LVLGESLNIIELIWGISREEGGGGKGGWNARKMSNLLPRFSLMLPYLTLSSVVGVIPGTTSGIMPEDWKAERTSAARAGEMPGVKAHVDCCSLRYGDAYAVEAAKRREREDFIVAILVTLVSRFQRWKTACSFICYCVGVQIH